MIHILQLQPPLLLVIDIIKIQTDIHMDILIVSSSINAVVATEKFTKELYIC